MYNIIKAAVKKGINQHLVPGSDDFLLDSNLASQKPPMTENINWNDFQTNANNQSSYNPFNAKNHSSSNAYKQQDWEKILNYVIPESGSTQKVSSFTKRANIVDRLKQLEKHWSTYSPTIEPTCKPDCDKDLENASVSAASIPIFLCSNADVSLIDFLPTNDQNDEPKDQLNEEQSQGKSHGLRGDLDISCDEIDAANALIELV